MTDFSCHMQHIICGISYASSADTRILEAQLCCWWSQSKCPLASSCRWSSCFLLLNAAKNLLHSLTLSVSLLHFPKSGRCPFTVLLWTSETGGTVIGLASTLMVLDHSVGSSRRPRVVGTDHDRPIGSSLLILQSRSPYIPNKLLVRYYIEYYSAGL